MATLLLLVGQGRIELAVGCRFKLLLLELPLPHQLKDAPGFAFGDKGAA
jgi:hypothetical protein